MAETIKLNAPYAPAGDQPLAIAKILQALQRGDHHHVLLGVTGSGKTFTMAQVIAKLGRSALVIAPNKTLAAQLYLEMKALFPEEAVGYFISYYDYYQPEAYIPTTDTYIAKDSAINEDIDKMRHEATRLLFEKKQAIIVASVSCIYGLGSPQSYASMMIKLKVGQEMSRSELLRKLIDIQYARNDAQLIRGHFRVRGDSVDILPSHQKDEAIRVHFFGDEIEGLSLIDALTGKRLHTIEEMALYPNSHFITERKAQGRVVGEILHDLGVRLRELKGSGDLVAMQRLEQRTMHDVETIEQLGYCPGIENYSRYLTGKKAGEPPPCLLDYFPEDFLTIIDESHITVPQIRGMYRGDRSRKQTLVDFGFRLPSALDNRPLNFDEFLGRTHQVLYVSATPGPYELEASPSHSEQVIRPTGLVDPEIVVRPARSQVDDLVGEMKKAIARDGRVLVTTLTKKMAEDLSTYYQELGFRVKYLHADIDTLERSELLRDLRRGAYDVLIGINLLREGLDLPEVVLVAVMDCDKEGFLRSRSSLIQIVGRAARNDTAKVIFYADRITDSMQAAMDETNRRRQKQQQYNKEHGITPRTVIKSLPEDLRVIYGLIDRRAAAAAEEEAGIADRNKLEKKLAELGIKTSNQLSRVIKRKEKDMHKLAGNLEFEKAAQLRDELRELGAMLLVWQEGQHEHGH